MDGRDIKKYSQRTENIRQFIRPKSSGSDSYEKGNEKCLIQWTGKTEEL